MLTDDEIKERLQRAGYTSGPFYEDPRIFTELCTRLLSAEAKVVDLKSLIKNSDPYLISALTSENNDLKARVKVLEAELLRAADSMTCKGNGPDAAHYCPNCDNTMYGPRDRARTALQETSK
jgi:hypothetical protein